jgi:hypothetical protein
LPKNWTFSSSKIIFYELKKLAIHAVKFMEQPEWIRFIEGKGYRLFLPFVAEIWHLNLD